MNNDITKILESFAIDGKLSNVVEHKRGHINTTWIGTWRTVACERRFVHQKINHHVFQDVSGLMSNIQRVTDHLQKAASNGDYPDITLSIVPAKNGKLFIRDEHGEYWRTFDYIEETSSYDVCPHSEAAHESASILGRFQKALSNLSTNSLIETIPDFHNAPTRFEALQNSVEADSQNRAASCGREIEFGLGSRAVAGSLIESLKNGSSLLRVTHNDMKLNNVLFDSSGHRARALVDLDTCMPGSVLFDFGDFARNTSIRAAEDEIDHSKIQIDFELFEAITRGYLRALGNTLTKRELELLVVSPRVLALTLGTRFLTDHLNGDTYFRIHRPGQNLERARAQYAVAERFRDAQGQLEEILKRSVDDGFR